MSNFFEFTGIKIIPALISFIAAILFLIPFSHGIINIGNCAGAFVSAALTACFVFFRPFCELVKQMWSKPAGKIFISVFSSIAGICLIFAVTVSIFMLKAASLLLYTEYTDTEISNLLGFSSQSYFIKIFKKHTGTTPKTYKKQFRLPPPTEPQYRLFRRDARTRHPVHWYKKI